MYVIVKETAISILQEDNMKDPKRIFPILLKIRQVWLMNPDMSLLQILLEPLAYGIDPLYIEDDMIEDKLDEMIENMKKGLSP